MSILAFFGAAKLRHYMRCAVALFAAVSLVCAALPIAANAQDDRYDLWREEEARRGPQSAVPPSPLFPVLPSFPTRPSLKETLDPTEKKLANCLLDHAKRSIEYRINPQDFNRIIDGACNTEASDYQRAVLSWLTATSPRLINEARPFSDRYVRNQRNEIVSIYTRLWYENAAKQNSPKAAPGASSGSGFFVSSNGHIVTNSHVVQDCARITFRSADGISATANLLARNETDDLAVLKSAETVREPARLRSISTPRLGEQVVVFGFPLAGTLTSTGNATTGNITGVAGLYNDPRHVQISAPVQPGNSGGPLLDMRGNFVGVVVGKLDALKVAVTRGDIPQNINFAIKGSVVANFLDAHGISYLVGQSEQELSVPDVVERAKGFSVAIVCEPNLTTSPRQPASDAQKKNPAENGDAPSPSQLSARTSEFLVRMYSVLSGPNTDAIKFLSDTYADNLQYYGKPLARDQVLGQLARFLERWPLRQYKTKAGSVNIQCDVKALVCAAKGTIEFDSRSPARNERSSGLATFEYTLSYSSPTAIPRVTVEGGAVIERRKGVLSSDVSSPR